MPFLRSLPADATLADLRRVYAGLLERLRPYADALMRGPSPLAPGERELIAAYVSAVNSCRYCYGVHAEVARRFGVDEALLDRLIEDLDAAPADARLKPLLHYARKLTETPAQMSEDDAAAVFAVGWDDAALFHVIAVCAYFNMMNRLVEGSGIVGTVEAYASAAAQLVTMGYRSTGSTAADARAVPGPSMATLAECDAPDALTSRLLRLDVCTVSDALDKLGCPGVVSGLKQLSGGARIAGRVLTVRLGVGQPPPGAMRHLGTAAIAAARPGEVIVVEQRSGVEAASWGGILTLAASLKGVAGVVADGLVRDIDEARVCAFPVFARGCTARTARGRIVEKATNEPVTIGDVIVHPSDYVIADGSGVAFIAARNASIVLETAEAIAAREAEMTKALLAGQPVTEVMGAGYESLLVY
jgi:uncharacterized peroxidase-related enzyme